MGSIDDPGVGVGVAELAAEERRWLQQAVAYVVQNRSFPDWEVRALLGFDAERLRALGRAVSGEGALTLRVAREACQVWAILLVYPRVDPRHLEGVMGRPREQQRIEMRRLRERLRCEVEGAGSPRGRRSP